MKIDLILGSPGVPSGKLDYDPKTGVIEAFSSGGSRIISGKICRGLSARQVGGFLDDLFNHPDLSLPVMVTLLPDGHTITISNEDYLKMTEKEQYQWRHRIGDN
jgi:hypothetical protein